MQRGGASVKGAEESASSIGKTETGRAAAMGRRKCGPRNSSTRPHMRHAADTRHRFHLSFHLPSLLGSHSCDDFALLDTNFTATPRGPTKTVRSAHGAPPGAGGAPRVEAGKSGVPYLPGRPIFCWAPRRRAGLRRHHANGEHDPTRAS